MLEQPPACLHQPVLQARQRPALDPVRQSEPSPQVTQVVGQHAQLQSHFVGPEAMTRQPRPVRGLFTFFDPLLGRAALVVEPHHRAAWQGHARHDESDAREQLALVMLDLGDNPPRLRPALGLKAAKFPVTKSLDTFDFPSLPALNKKLVLELARCEFIDRRENVLALGNSGTGKTHIGLALGLAACQRGYRTRFTTAAAPVNELLEARDERRLLRCQKQLAKQDLLIVDELGYVPLSKTGAELLFEVFSQRYEQGSTLVIPRICRLTNGRRSSAPSG